MPKRTPCSARSRTGGATSRGPRGCSTKRSAQTQTSLTPGGSWSKSLLAVPPGCDCLQPSVMMINPLIVLAIGVEAGWFATPLVPLTIRLEPMAFRLPDVGVRRLWSAEFAAAGFIPSARLETEIAGGMLQRVSGVDAMDWRGRAALGLRLAPGFTLRGRAERAPYLHTTSSITTPVMTNTASGVLQVDHALGWLGEGAIQAERFPDGNMITSASGWLLAPLVYRDRLKLQAGYAFGMANADESRFALAASSQPYDPADPRFDTAGRYVPYYTPMNVVTHSLTAAVALHARPSAVIRLSGSYAVHATEDAPAFVTSGGQLQFTTIRRTFSPWKAASALDVAIRDGLTLGVVGELGRTAFYRWGTADIHLTYRFWNPTAPHASRP